MKRTLPTLLFILTAIAGFSQDQNFVEVSYGAGYTNQVFVELATGDKVSIANMSWDIAFTVDARGSGISINEATGSSGGELALHKAPTNNFEDAINIEDLGSILYNTEESWEMGAFNRIAVSDDPFSLGWGNYNPQDKSISAAAVYVLKLRDDSYKKLQITSLSNGIYTFKHADLDGENEVTLTVDKADFEGENVAFFSLTEGKVIEEVPAKWDLLFTRYYTILDAGGGQTVDYLLTGTLQNAGVEVAQVDGIDPKTVEYVEDEMGMETNLDVIGWDWKDFDRGSFTWTLPKDRVYFVKTADEKIYQLQFIDFEGSSTGNAVFEQSEVSATTTSVLEADSQLETLNVFPNPAKGPINVAYTMKQRGQVQFSIRNILGQQIWQQQQQVPAGFQAFQVPDLQLAAGSYLLQIQIGQEVITETLLIE